MCVRFTKCLRNECECRAFLSIFENFGSLTELANPINCEVVYRPGPHHCVRVNLRFVRRPVTVLGRISPFVVHCVFTNNTVPCREVLYYGPTGQMGKIGGLLSECVLFRNYNVMYQCCQSTTEEVY